MKVLILAGGLGTRLRPLVSDVPKILAPSPIRPFLEIILISLYKNGFKEIALSLGYKSEKVIDWIKKTNLPKDLVIDYIVEEQPLGTGGAIQYSYNKWRDDFLILNGDTFLDGSRIKNFYTLASRSKDLTIGLVRINKPDRYGSVEIDATQNVLKFTEKSTSSASLINAGIYFIPKEFSEKLPTTPHSLEKEVFPLLVNEKKLKAILLESFFIDIGVPEDYNYFCRLVEDKKINNEWL